MKVWIEERFCTHECLEWTKWKVNHCKIQLEPFYNDERDIIDGFEGECQNCGHDDAWEDI